MPKKTPEEALKMMVKEIGAYRGAAIERAVYGVIGASSALAAVGLITSDEACDWTDKARQAGIRQGWDPSQAARGDWSPHRTTKG